MKNEVIQNSQNSEAIRLRQQVKRKKIALSTVYYVFGTLLAVLFLFPLVYMIATSTKSESAYASDAGSLMMFLPDFKNLSAASDNYGKVFTSYGIWKYALNSVVYAAIIIVLNIIVNGLAGYVMAKFDFPGKGFFSFIILFLNVPL